MYQRQELHRPSRIDRFQSAQTSSTVPRFRSGLRTLEGLAWAVQVTGGLRQLREGGSVTFPDRHVKFHD